MGEVYKARDTRLDRTVAIKVLPAQLAADSQFRARFDREARAISQLTHPHICTLYDVGEHDGTAFLVMELLDGETLADRLTKGALPPAQALTIGIEIASALDAAHRAGIVHRDLKPGNVMLTKAGAKLLDFGLAKTNAPVVAVSGTMAPTTPAEPHRAGHDPRHVPVHGAGADRRRRGRCAHRHLRVRLRPVRDAHRPEGVRRQDAREPARRDHARRAAAGVAGAARRASRPQSHRREMPREGSRRSLAVGARFDARAEMGGRRRCVARQRRADHVAGRARPGHAR